MSELTILQVAGPFSIVSQDSGGSAEQVLRALDQAVTASGNRSLVIAAEGSEIAGKLLSLPEPEKRISDSTREKQWTTMRKTLREALALWPVDLVHFHGMDFDRYLPDSGVPAIATLHLPLPWYRMDALKPQRPLTYLHCVSRSQKDQAQEPLELLEEIPNGIDLNLPRFDVRRRNYCLMLGRIRPEKGFHTAIGAAKRAEMPLLIAGRALPYAEHELYFDREIRPRLDEKRRFLGPVRLRAKRRLLSGARCLLVPSTAPEASSLVAMEAMACGTPVIAFPSGALSEIVSPGKTGFLVRDESEMAAAISLAATIRPETCREAAAERFSEDRMIRAHCSRSSDRRRPSSSANRSLGKRPIPL